MHIFNRIFIRYFVSGSLCILSLFACQESTHVPQVTEKAPFNPQDLPQPPRISEREGFPLIDEGEWYYFTSNSPYSTSTTSVNSSEELGESFALDQEEVNEADEEEVAEQEVAGQELAGQELAGQEAEMGGREASGTEKDSAEERIPLSELTPPYLQVKHTLISRSEGTEQWNWTAEGWVYQSGGSQPEWVSVTLQLEVLAPTDLAGSRISVAEIQFQRREGPMLPLIDQRRRKFEPPYTLLLDSTKVDRVRERQTRRATTVKENNMDLVEMIARTELSEESISVLIRGNYINEVYELKVYDELGDLPSRAFWIKPGIGVIRFYDATLAREGYTLWFK